MSAKKRRKRSSKVTRNAAQSKKITRPSPRKGLSSGPRKSEVKKLVAKLKVYRPSRIHKLRAGWFKARVSWPLRDRSAAYLHTQRRSSARRIAAAPVAANAVWQDAGPTNIGGRATAIVFDPANPDRILLGTGGGGVWKSLDAGQTWSPTMRTQEHNIGALALDPGDARIVYCGTGEANLSADSYAGIGLYKSSNFGGSWRLLASSTKTGIPTRIGAIAVDPFDARHLMLGGVSHAYDDKSESNGGLFTSQDSGVTWALQTFVSPYGYWCHDVVFHPTRQGTVYAAVTENGAKNGIWISRDGGATWLQATHGLPDTDRFGRTRFAIAPSQPDTVYAVAALANSDELLGIFRSDDAGAAWRSATGNFGNASQMSYGLAIVVHPQDPDHVLCGGVDLRLSLNGGATWRRATQWDAVRGDPVYAHADHHALAMPAAAPGRVYDVNDGGLDVSEDGGRNWSNRSNGLACTMFYDLEVAQSDAGIYGGGAQDNGTVLTGNNAPGAFEEISGGDGGWIVIDPANPGYMYASSQYTTVVRYRNGQWSPWQNPMPYGMPNAERESIWMSYIVMDPADARVVYVGTKRVWRTSNAGTNWTPVSPFFDDSPITVIEPAAADSDTIYVGTENGGVFRTLDRGATWSANLSSAMLPGRTITRLESSPDNANQVYAAIANYGDSHVYRSDDAGASWLDIDNGMLPDVPHRSIVVTPDDPHRVIVANDAGVYLSPDRGASWTNLTRNLPAISVVDVVYHRATTSLFAATYGRGIWRLQL